MAIKKVTQQVIKEDIWHEIGTAGEPAFANSWVNYDGTWASAGFTKDSNGFVHLKGLIKSGTLYSTMFTLPVGYRPAKITMNCVVCHNGAGYLIGRLDVSSNGTVKLTDSGGNTFASLENVTFKAA